MHYEGTLIVIQDQKSGDIILKKDLSYYLKCEKNGKANYVEIHTNVDKNNKENVAVENIYLMSQQLNLNKNEVSKIIGKIKKETPNEVLGFRPSKNNRLISNFYEKYFQELNSYGVSLISLKQLVDGNFFGQYKSILVKDIIVIPSQEIPNFVDKPVSKKKKNGDEGNSNKRIKIGENNFNQSTNITLTTNEEININITSFYFEQNGHYMQPNPTYILFSNSKFGEMMREYHPVEESNYFQHQSPQHFLNMQNISIYQNKNTPILFHMENDFPNLNDISPQYKFFSLSINRNQLFSLEMKINFDIPSKVTSLFNGNHNQSDIKCKCKISFQESLNYNTSHNKLFKCMKIQLGSLVLVVPILFDVL